MKEIKDMILSFKNSDFRPDDWKEKIAEITGFSESQVEKVFYGNRFNKKIALEIIRFFTEEKKKLQLEIEEAKQ
jgi:hypothetical protein